MATIHPSQSADHVRQVMLRWSALGFAALFGILAFGYFGLFDLIASPAQRIWSGDARELVLVMVLPVLPVAALSWWLLVVLPHDASAPAGGCAGLLTIVLGMLCMCATWVVVAFLMRAHGITTPWQVIEATFTFWLFGIAIACVQPWGWGMFLLGGVVGGLYGELIRRATRRLEVEAPIPRA